MTVKHNTCRFDNKYCEKLWIAVYNQSTTDNVYASPSLQNNITTCHTSTKPARRLTRARFYVSASNNVYCVVLITPSADPQRPSAHINNIETQTAINYIITPDDYQALLWGPQWVCLVFLLK